MSRLWAVVLTLCKTRVAVSDSKAAVAAAGYALHYEESPQAFARDGDRDGPERASTMWLGSEEALGVLGLERGSEVGIGELALALQGLALDGSRARHPGSVAAVDRDGHALLRNGEPYRIAVVNSYRLAFSAPKSVSIVWAMADRELRAEIERGMFAAANALMEHITQTRRVVQGEQVGEGFAAAMALHVAGRPAKGESVPAPQLHMHIDWVGVLDANGGLRTPESGSFYKQSGMREAGAVGRSVLAETMRKLGFGIEWGTGNDGRYFEIRGVSEELRRKLSGRSRDVGQWVKEQAARFGPLSNRQMALGGLATRTPKSGLAPGVVQGAWEAICSRFGHASERNALLRAEERVLRELERELAGEDPAAFEQRRLQECRAIARETILARIWKQGPTVTMGAVRSIAFELAPMGLSNGETVTLLSEMHAAGELVVLDGWLVTSRAIRDAELYVRKVALSAARRRAAPLAREAIDAGIAAAEAKLGGHELDPEQREAVELLTSGVGWASLTGLAGTGKGPVLQAVAKAFELQGFQVIAGALDGATTARLGYQVGAQALTVEQLSVRLDSGHLTLDPNTVIMIDEASKLGLRQFHRLARAIDESHARMFPVGDDGQIGAIECPGMFDVLLDKDNFSVAELEVVRRHRNPDDKTQEHPWLPAYNLALHTGGIKNAEFAIGLLRENNALTMHDTREEAMEGLVAQWEARRREHDIKVAETMLIVYGSNDDVDCVNELAQRRRLDAGEIEGQGVRASDRDYDLYEGDLVILREIAYQPERVNSERQRRIENGAVGMIDSVDEATGEVWVSFRQPDGATRQVRIDLAGLRAQQERQLQLPASERQRVASLRLSYAWHPFPAQGANARYVGSLWGHHTQHKEEGYSGDMRAICWLDVHMDRESTGRDKSDAERLKGMAKRLAENWHRRASITYEETPEARIELALSDQPLVPDTPVRAKNLPGTPREMAGDNRDQAPAADALQIEDPLERYRTLLGPKRLTRLGEQADQLNDRYRELDVGALQAERELGRLALAQLDRKTALRLGRIEHDLPLLGARVNETQARVDELTARGDVQAAKTQRQTFIRDDAQLAALVDAELDIYKRGLHPQQWMTEHGADFVRGIAAARQLVLHAEQAIQTQIAQASRHPPEYVTAAIGAPPASTASSRAEWEQLTHQLVRERRGGTSEHSWGLEPDQRGEKLKHREDTPPQPGAKLHRRVEEFRKRQGLTPQAHRQEINLDGDGSGLD